MARYLTGNHFSAVALTSAQHCGMPAHLSAGLERFARLTRMLFDKLATSLEICGAVLPPFPAV